MRYDSMLATALQRVVDDAGGRVAQWRQLVDLFVQANGKIAPAVRDAAAARIAALRAFVPVAQRRLAAVQSASRASDVDSLLLFARDEPRVAAPVLASAMLENDGWLALISQIPPASRALLRNRRDLPASAVRALASYGSSDFALPAVNPAVDAEPAIDRDGQTGTQIRDLVARIEAFRLGVSATAALDATAEPAPEFSFETSSDGLFDWIAGVPREGLIGLSIGDIAPPGAYGVDGQVAGAFRRRAPFRDGRLAVAGTGAASGQWLIAGRPVFDPRDGRFAGYHGNARRPRPDELAAPQHNDTAFAMPVDSLRQLIHEMRTPLNAILGFAEMIDRQLLGPAAYSYRAQAQTIVKDGARLLELVDDLDQAARIKARANTASPAGSSDIVAVAAQTVKQLAPVAEARSITIQINADDTLIEVGVERSILDRMMARLVGAVLNLSDPDDVIDLTLHRFGSGHVELAVTRPRILGGLADADLLDPNFDPDVPYPDAPILGLGFTLRLLDGMAREIGGRFSIRAAAFVVTLPTAAARADLPAGTP